MTLLGGRRRLRYVFMAFACIFIIFLFTSSHDDYRLSVPSFGPSTKDDQFEKQVVEQVNENAEISTEHRALKDSLAEAEQKAKTKAEKKDKERQAIQAANTVKEIAHSDVPKAPPSDEIIEFEYKDLLSKSPIVIFSKTYCPYSHKVKSIFADYDIDPRPFIVELDKHPYGAELQAKLGQKTQRTTVPNVMINGVTLGGGDDVEVLHEQGKLAAMVLKMAGGQVTAMSHGE